MRKTLITYVKPHVQEDPLAMVLGIAYLGAALEKEKIPVELCDERIVNDAYKRKAKILIPSFAIGRTPVSYTHLCVCETRTPRVKSVCVRSRPAACDAARHHVRTPNSAHVARWPAC